MPCGNAGFGGRLGAGVADVFARVAGLDVFFGLVMSRN